MQEELFEWIVCVGKKEYCLTENQHLELLKKQNNKLVVFDNFSINPAYITSTYKQKAKNLKKIYPCNKCKTNGSNTVDGKYIICENCVGTGVDFKIEAKQEFILLE